VTERIVVTLIHGTFAPEAPWVKDGSKLRCAIQKAFPDAVEFRTLCWSGGNTIGARRDAAEKLRKQIVNEPFGPNTRHFLVAHSHGGNIALYALRDPVVRERIAGVATLATPFLIARRRDLGAQGRSLFCVGFLGWGWLASALIRRFMWPSAEWLPAILGTAFFMLLTVLVTWLWHRAGKVAEDLQLHAPAQGRLWIARMSGDEATAGLQTAQFAGTIVAQMQLSFVKANAWAEKTGRNSWWISVWRVAGGLAVAVLFWGVGTYLGVDDRSAPVLWTFIIAIGIGGLIILWGLLLQAPRVVVPFAAGLVAPLAFALPILLVPPFGRAVAVYSFLLELSAEATPLGSWTVNQYKPVLDDAGSGLATPGLTHSRVYDQPDVLEDLVTWMIEPTPGRQPYAGKDLLH
jgi:MFS family permease